MNQDISAAISLAFQNTSSTEWLVFITALMYVVLAAIENVWCWLFGIISSLLSIYLCITGNLFLESGLQVFYVIMGLYGWYQWEKGYAAKKIVSITSFPIIKNMPLLFIGCIIWLLLSILSSKYSTQAMPYLDGFITAFSIIATWMTAKKIIENWLYWIVVDALAVVLYASRDFYLIALLYVVYTIIALAGYLKWKNKLTALSA